MNKFLTLTGLVLMLSACGGGSTNTESENDDQPNQSSTNTAPVAEINVTDDLFTDSIITLDGSSSSDADGDSLVYSWSLQSQPSGSKSTLVDNDLNKTSFTADIAGEYKISLIVNDGQIDSALESVILNVEEKMLPPVAAISGFEKVAVSGRYQLDGSDSYDEDGEISAYYWQLISKPDGSELVLDNGFSWEEKPALYDDSPKSWFHLSPDVAGSYSIQLTVVDNDGQASDPEEITFDAVVNDSPEGDFVYMGGVKNLFGGEQYVYLDVSDPDNDELTYSWNLDTSPESSSYSQQSSAKDYFAIKTDIAGDYKFEYEFSDGYYTIDSSSVGSTLYTYSYPKTIDTGGVENEEINFVNQFRVIDSFWTMPVAHLNSKMEFDFSAIISPQGTALTYQLELVKGPDGAKAITTKSQLSPEVFEFEADKAGFYVFDLTVSDGDQTVSTWPTVAGRVMILAQLVEEGESTGIVGNIPEYLFVKGNEPATISALSIQSESFLSYSWSLESESKSYGIYPETRLLQDVEQSVQFEKVGLNKIKLEVTDSLGEVVALNTVLNVYSEIKPNYFQFDTDYTAAVIGSEVVLSPEVNLLNGSSIQWNIISAPSSSNLQGHLIENDSMSFVPDAKGNYVVQGLIKHNEHIIYYGTHKVMASEDGVLLQAVISDVIIDESLGQVSLSADNSTNNTTGELQYSWMLQGASGFVENDIELSPQTDGSIKLTYPNTKRGQLVIKLKVTNELGYSNTSNKIITL